MNFAREKGLAGRRAAVALALALVASAAFAIPPLARMDDNDRQRLRQDLRQQQRARSEREPAQRGNDAAPPWAQRGAPPRPAPDAWQGRPEQSQGRPEQWQDGPRQGRPARGAAGPDRPRLTPEERQQLREQLRARQQGWRR